jgi:hypothetical protein
MEGKAKYIFPVVMSGQMVLMVTLLVTYLNLGFPADFVRQWMKAFAIAWPVAASAAYVAIPTARRLTQRIVALIDENS